MKKTITIVVSIVLGLAAIWFGTVWLQKPPQYPTSQTDFDAYFDDFRMDYSVDKQGLIEDIDSIIAYTDEVHSNPYRITSRTEFLEKAEAIKSQIRAIESEQIPVQDAYFMLQELVALLQDGHTTLYPLNWEYTVDKILPLMFTSIDERIFVSQNYGDNDIPERAEILEINGVSIEQMTDDCLKFMPGTLTHLKQARFAEQLGLLIQVYYHMPSPWEVTYRHNGTVATTIVHGISLEEYQVASGLQPEFTEMEADANGIKVPVMALQFTGFGDSEWDDYKPFVDDFFAQHQEEPYLVIDVRHHHGGDGDWGVYALSYLADNLKGYEEFTFKASPLHQEIIDYAFRYTYYDMSLPQFLWGLPLYKLVEQDDPYYWIGRGVYEAEPNTFYDAQWEDSRSYLADGTVPRYQGQVFLLTSHETFSAGAYLAGLFRGNDLGTIVGQETGGRVYMESDMRPVFLPNSNLMYLVPVARFTTCKDDPDRGVIPDVIVGVAPGDYINFHDSDMEYVVDLINALE
jgi:hypothetical protein